MALYLVVLLELQKLNIRRVNNNLHLDMQTTSRTRGGSGSMSPPRSQIASSTTNNAAAVARQSAAATSHTMTDQERKATNCIQMFTRVLMK